ncbi:hypothetical protein RUM43_004712 [Polyplax serrata]|uniref:Uncharacterized protein n=1 Tax=Polyplax serrata TaxID=468196 RepID=A0AAN8XLK6_POLSC
MEHARKQVENSETTERQLENEITGRNRKVHSTYQTIAFLPPGLRRPYDFWAESVNCQSALVELFNIFQKNYR